MLDSVREPDPKWRHKIWLSRNRPFQFEDSKVCPMWAKSRIKHCVHDFSGATVEKRSKCCMCMEFFDLPDDWLEDELGGLFA